MLKFLYEKMGSSDNQIKDISHRQQANHISHYPINKEKVYGLESPNLMMYYRIAVDCCMKNVESSSKGHFAMLELQGATALSLQQEPHMCTSPLNIEKMNL